MLNWQILAMERLVLPEDLLGQANLGIKQHSPDPYREPENPVAVGIGAVIPTISPVFSA
jgi:hypothetical protein